VNNLNFDFAFVFFLEHCIDIGFSEVFYIVLHMVVNFKCIDNYEIEQIVPFMLLLKTFFIFIFI
jgi:hypothetical protein